MNSASGFAAKSLFPKSAIVFALAVEFTAAVGGLNDARTVGLKEAADDVGALQAHLRARAGQELAAGPGLGLLLPAHARPDVRADDVGAGHGLAGIAREREVGGAALGLQLGPDPGARLEARRPGKRDPHPEEARPEDP